MRNIPVRFSCLAIATLVTPNEQGYEECGGRRNKDNPT